METTTVGTVTTTYVDKWTNWGSSQTPTHGGVMETTTISSGPDITSPSDFDADNYMYAIDLDVDMSDSTYFYSKDYGEVNNWAIEDFVKDVLGGFYEVETGNTNWDVDETFKSILNSALPELVDQGYARKFNSRVELDARVAYDYFYQFYSDYAPSSKTETLYRENLFSRKGNLDRPRSCGNMLN